MNCKFSAIALALSLALFAPLPQAEDNAKIDLPDLGDSSGTLLTPAEENELGEAFFRSLHSQIQINQDAEIQQYIQTVGEKLVANSDAPSQPFHFFVVMENDINAFAGPGGYIGVNSGLILITEEESELASVMGHEIAHVTQRHLYRAAEAAGRLSIPTMAGMLAAILLGTQSAAAGQAAIMAIQAGSVQFQIDFTRENEEEADRVGMQTLAASHFDPRCMPTFFERLQQSSRYYGQNIPEFLRTHPVTTSRISDSRGRAETYPYKQYPDSLAYQLTKAKIRVLSSTNIAETAGYFQSRLNQGTDEQRTVTRYGLALTAIAQQKYKDAENMLQALVKQFPNQPHYASALARNAQEAKDFPTALKRYQQLMVQYPENPAIKLEYIVVLLKVGQVESAKDQLLALSVKTKTTPAFWSLLAEVYGKLNQPAESHRYLAEYYYASGQMRDAILQIRLAQKSKGLTFHLASILEDRLHFFLAQEEEARRNR
ncbi:M48 family metallopeptidase [Methylosoma difficile]